MPVQAELRYGCLLSLLCLEHCRADLHSETKKDAELRGRGSASINATALKGVVSHEGRGKRGSRLVMQSAHIFI